MAAAAAAATATAMTARARAIATTTTAARRERACVSDVAARRSSDVATTARRRRGRGRGRSGWPKIAERTVTWRDYDWYGVGRRAATVFQKSTRRTNRITRDAKPRNRVVESRSHQRRS